MTKAEMIAACNAAIARGSKAITFVLPGYASGNTRRLLGRRGPRGEVVADTEHEGKPESLVAFDPVKVVDFLTREE